MTRILVLFTLLATVALSVSDIPPAYEYLYGTMCQTCSSVASCLPPLDSAYNYTIGDWQCVEFNVSLTETASLCAINECTAAIDCDTGEVCRAYSCCDANTKEGMFYDSSEISSYICVAEDICETITDTKSSICYEGSDEVRYSSEEEGRLCGGADEMGVCMSPETKGCNSFNPREFLEKAFTVWLWYTVSVIAVAVCILGACCFVCCRACKKKKAQGRTQQSGYDVNSHSDHYDVHI